MPQEKARKSAKWDDFVLTMSSYLKLTENITLKHFYFKSNIQKDSEKFIAFCYRLSLEAIHCSFHPSANYTSEETAVRDQVIIVLKDNNIQEKALKKSRDLEILRREGMKIESVSRWRAEISDESILKVGAYSHKATKKKMTGRNISIK